MDFKEIMNFSDTTNTIGGAMLYILAGVGALLLILLIVWLLFKLSAFISKKKGDMPKKEEPSDEEQLFGD